MNRKLFAFRMLKTFCPDHLYEEIEGDLIQKFNRDATKFSQRKAKRRLYWNTLRFIRPGIILRNKLPQKIISTIMIQNYLIVAWRSFLKRKTLGTINLIGISFGIAFAMLAFLFIYDEFSFDSHHKNKADIYRVDMLPIKNGEPDMDARLEILPMPLIPALKQSVPGIIHASRYTLRGNYLTASDKQFFEVVHYVDEDFLRMFSLQFIDESRPTLLAEMHNILISDKKALKLFGTTEAIGKTIEIDTLSFVVSGVFKDFGKKSSLECEMLMRFEHFPPYRDQQDDWNASYTNAFVQLDQDIEPKELEVPLKQFWKTELSETGYNDNTLALISLQDVHFDSKIRWHNVSNRKYSYILGTIAVIVLLIACINYVLLSLAGSLPRAREIGVRKVIGATRRMIRSQFLSESLVLIAVSIPISFFMLYLILPEFNSFMGRSIALSEANRIWIGGLFGIMLITGLLAGGYPAIILSNLVPGKILKRNLSGNYKTKFSGALIIFQFAACLVLIMCSLVMFNQMKLVQNYDLGFNKDQVIAIDISNDFDIKGRKIIENFKTELIHDRYIRMISGISSDFGTLTGSSSYTDSTGKKVTEYYAYVDYDFFELLNIKPIAGRVFSKDYPADSINRYVVNEAFVKQMGASSALGKMPRDKNSEIIGVIPDFHFQSLEHEVKPFAFRKGKDFWSMLVKVSPENIPQSIGRLEQIWHKVVGGGKLKYSFLDDQLNSQYNRHTQWIRLVTISASLAIGISCLGLLGIISLAVINRTKEVSIRKVLGASTTAILTLFSKYYVRLIIFAFVFAAPAAYYLATLWLKDFAYKIEIGWLHYIYPLVGLIGLALVIVGSQVIKTVKINPAETLKSE